MLPLPLALALFNTIGDNPVYINTSDHRAMEQYTQDGSSLPDVLGLTPASPLRTGGFMLEAVARFVDAVAYDHPAAGDRRGRPAGDTDVDSYSGVGEIRAASRPINDYISVSALFSDCTA